MKFISIAATLILSAQVGFSQQLPVDPETKLISYTAVVDVPSTPKDSLYKRASAWFRSHYKNPADVIKEQDPESGTITGIHRFKIIKEVPGSKKNDPPVKNDAGLVSYTVKIMVKDNKYKYELTKINWKQASYYPIERWTDTKAQSYDPSYNLYLIQTDEYMKKLAEDLKAGMAKTGEKKKADW